MTDREVGQVWKWHNGPGEWYLCVLLEYQGFDWADREERWLILDLDTENAGRTTTAHFRVDQTAYGKDSYWELLA